MNILLINTPSRKGPGGLMLPLGFLYLGSMIEKAGHSVRIYDPYIEDAELRDLDSGNFQKLDGIIEEYKPDVIGYGGIGSSYGRAKRISLHVKERHPAILQIAGGALSSVYRLLLTKTGVTLVFHGETEVSFPIFLSRFQNKFRIASFDDSSPGSLYCRLLIDTQRQPDGNSPSIARSSTDRHWSFDHLLARSCIFQYKMKNSVGCK